LNVENLKLFQVVGDDSSLVIASDRDDVFEVLLEEEGWETLEELMTHLGEHTSVTEVPGGVRVPVLIERDEMPATRETRTASEWVVFEGRGVLGVWE
jgi:hypothetical protein